MNSVKENKLSFYNDLGILVLSAKQYDTGRKFIFNIIDNDEPFDLTGCSVYLRVLKADGTQFQGEDCCLIEGNTIIVDTSIGNGEQILTCPGSNTCELHLQDQDGKSLTTWNFIIDVSKRVHNGDGVASIDSWDAWDKVKDTVDDFNNKIAEHYFVLTMDKDIAGGVPSLDENTKVPISELYEATTESKGITQLEDSISSNSTTTAATPNSVKTVNDNLMDEKNRAKDVEKTIADNLSAEIARAKSAESALLDDLNDEVKRASDAEKILTDNLSTEVTNRINAINDEKTARENADTAIVNSLNNEIDRAKTAEKTLTDNLNSEITRATDAESVIADNLASEITRAEASEKANTDAINEEVTRSKAKENEIVTNLSNEIIRATTAESTIISNLDAEISRAKNAESILTTDLNSEVSRATSSEQNIANNLTAEITRAKDAEKINADNISTEISRATDAENTISNNLSSEVTRATNAENNLDSKKADKTSVYTKNEVDNKFSSLETNIDWKESVATYDDIATTYPSPVDGWTVNVKDTDYTYRYNGISWVAISANAIPKATNNVDGLLSKEDHTNYEDANSKKHTHSNKSVLDGISSTNVSNWNSAKTHADSTHARTDATKVEKSSTNGNIKINDTETTVYTHPGSGTNPHGTTKSDVGLGNVGNFKAVSTVASQGLTDTEKSNARTNIGAGTSNFSGSYTDLTNKPTLGTASSKDVASNGNASTSQVVMGNDTRLTDSRKASDVYSWAKSSTKPTYTASDVGLGNVPNVATNDQTPSYTEATSLAKLTSGEKLSVAFGKISKAITDLISHIGDSVKHITSTERTNWGTAYTHSQAAHAPSNAQANVQSDWNATDGDAFIKNKPESFTPSAHSHAIGDVGGLQEALNGKANDGHTHEIANVDGLNPLIDSMFPIEGEYIPISQAKKFSSSSGTKYTTTFDIGTDILKGDKYQLVFSESGYHTAICDYNYYDPSTGAVAAQQLEFTFENDSYNVKETYVDDIGNTFTLGSVTVETFAKEVRLISYKKVAKDEDLSNYLPLSGGTVSGDVTFNGNVSGTGMDKYAKEANIPLQLKEGVTDANGFTKGIAWCSNNSIANCPYPNGLLTAIRESTVGYQLFTGYQNSGIWYRDVTNVWTNPWVRIDGGASGDFVPTSYGAFDVNTLYDNGVYGIQNGSNCPIDYNYGTLFVMSFRKASGNASQDSCTQIFIPSGYSTISSNSMFYRTSEETSWHAWVEVAKSSDLNNYLPKSGGNITGDIDMGSNNLLISGLIGGEFDGGETNHAIRTGAYGRDYMDFYEYGAIWNFYKSQSDVNTLVARITENGFEGNASTATNANHANQADIAGMLTGFSSVAPSQPWGNQTGTFIFGMNDSTGGSIAFRRDNPSGGKLSMIIDGTVYVNEGYDAVATQVDITNLRNSFQDGCNTIASAVTAMGVSTGSGSSPTEISNNIRAIASSSNILYSDDVVTGKIGYRSGQYISGTSIFARIDKALKVLRSSYCYEQWGALGLQKVYVTSPGQTLRISIAGSISYTSYSNLNIFGRNGIFQNNMVVSSSSALIVNKADISGTDYYDDLYTILGNPDGYRELGSITYSLQIIGEGVLVPSFCYKSSSGVWYSAHCLVISMNV